MPAQKILSDQQMSEVTSNTAKLIVHRASEGRDLQTVRDEMRDEMMVQFSSQLSQVDSAMFLSIYDAQVEAGIRQAQAVQVEDEAYEASLKPFDKAEVRRMARLYASEVTHLAKTGGDATHRCEQIDEEAKQYAKALRTEDISEFFKFFQAEFLAEMKHNSEEHEKSLKAKGRSRGQTLGEIAINTAVRATVWESVLALFRAFK